MRGRLLALILLSLLPWGLLETQAQAPPDIILLITDDMRTDDWRMLPQTHALVGGVAYPHTVYATPLCCPERCQFMTGQYAHTTDCTTNNTGWDAFKGRKADALGPALQAVGYHTAWVGKYLNLATDAAALGWDDWQGEPKGSYTVDGEYGTDGYRDRALAAIAAAPTDQPFFLGVSFYAPHLPATPPDRDAEADVGPVLNTLDRQRKRTLLSVDEAVVAIAGAMGPRWDDACVFVLSDNGYLLGEHGDHGKSIWWDQATRVPLRARCAGLSTGPGVDNRLVSTVDLLPTILRAAGTEAWWPVDGRALQDAWDRDGVVIESWALSSVGEPRNPWRGVKGKDWVYVEEKGHNPRLYRDAAEEDNLYGTLTNAEKAFYADWTQELKTCAEATCG